MDADDETGFPFPCFSARADAEAVVWKALATNSSATDGSRSREMMDASDYDCSIFPPYLHEGLHLRSESCQTIIPPHSPQQQIDPAVVPYFPKQEKGEGKSGTVSEPLLISVQRVVVSCLKLFRSGRCEGSAEILGLRVGVCVFAALAGFFLYRRRCHQREKEFLLFLIQEKDQRIDLLLHQIAELNAILAAHHKVPVLRKT